MYVIKNFVLNSEILFIIRDLGNKLVEDKHDNEYNEGPIRYKLRVPIRIFNELNNSLIPLDDTDENIFSKFYDLSDINKIVDKVVLKRKNYHQVYLGNVNNTKDQLLLIIDRERVVLEDDEGEYHEIMHPGKVRQFQEELFDYIRDEIGA